MVSNANSTTTTEDTTMTNPTKTTAEQIADRFDNSFCHKDAEGRSIEDVCREHGATAGLSNVFGTRFNFADGSAIIVGLLGWGLGFPKADCLCWQSAYYGQHANGCAAK